MPITASRPTDVLPANIFREAYVLVRSIEGKIKAKYEDADFDLLCGPDEALHLRVYSSAGSIWDVIELVEDDLIALEDNEGMRLFVIPVRHEDRERAHDPKTNGYLHTP